MDHVVTNKLKTTKDQLNQAINSDTTFDTNSFNLSSGTRNPLAVVTVSLLGGNKHIANTVYVLTCLWDSGATNRTIKRKHTKHYERKMRYNKVEYSAAAGVY